MTGIPPVWAIVGLGNPGKKYQDTRHNVGFWVIDQLQAKLKEQIFWKTREGCNFAKVNFAGQEVLLLLPQLYMNLSGQAILPTINFFKITPDKLLVAHDELDLLPGALRIKKGGSSGGHNGLEDIISIFGSEFYRFRIGIGHPRNDEKTRNIDVSSWVLGTPFAEDLSKIKDVSSKTVLALESFIEEGLTVAQRKYHS
ncbi:MAG: aminoacyl-tRNA hydrolase [Proteobacteria bacterium]|nr:aminoacyl-tRNA hydrolase [Pseudomonadota bacterium]